MISSRTLLLSLIALNLLALAWWSGAMDPLAGTVYEPHRLETQIEPERLELLGPISRVSPADQPGLAAATLPSASSVTPAAPLSPATAGGPRTAGQWAPSPATAATPVTDQAPVAGQVGAATQDSVAPLPGIVSATAAGTAPAVADPADFSAGTSVSATPAGPPNLSAAGYQGGANGADSAGLEMTPVASGTEKLISVGGQSLSESPQDSNASGVRRTGQAPFRDVVAPQPGLMDAAADNMSLTSARTLPAPLPPVEVATWDRKPVGGAPASAPDGKTLSGPLAIQADKSAPANQTGAAAQKELPLIAAAISGLEKSGTPEQPWQNTCIKYAGVSYASARELEDDLLSQGATVDMARVDSGNYLVYIEPLASLQLAQRKQEQLRRLGVRDMHLIRIGFYRNGISLGLLRSLERARLHVRQMASLGVTTMRIGPVNANGSRYEVTIRGPVALVQNKARKHPIVADLAPVICN